MMYYVPTFRANCKLAFISTNNVCRLFNYRIRLFAITSDFCILYEYDSIYWALDCLCASPDCGSYSRSILVVWVSVVTLVAQQIDSNFITPNVMGKSLDIHPLTVITIILAAGNIAGFIGIIIAVPFYAVLKVIVSNIYDQRNAIKKKRRSQYRSRNNGTRNCKGI